MCSGKGCVVFVYHHFATLNNIQGCIRTRIYLRMYCVGVWGLLKFIRYNIEMHPYHLARIEWKLKCADRAWDGW